MQIHCASLDDLQQHALCSGAGADTVLGGTGNDRLTSGASPDVFIFARNGGTDTITDNADTLQLNGNLWSGTLTAAQVVSMFAATVGANTVFTFTTGDILKVNGIANPADLVDDISIV